MLDSYQTAMREQADGFADLIAGADFSVTVPTCPEWTLGALVAHVGGAHRMATEAVRGDLTGMPTEEAVLRYVPPDGADLADWIRSGAGALADAVAAGPEDLVWTPIGQGPAKYWLRRMVLETMMHRVDASLTVGDPYTPHSDIAADGIDEWLMLLTSEAARMIPRLQALRGNGERLVVRDTDTGRTWVVVRGADGVQAGEPGDGDVTVQGPAGNLQLVLGRRADPSTVEVIGDTALFDHWLEHTAF